MTNSVLPKVLQFYKDFPSGWCQHAYALDARGRKVSARDLSAVAWDVHSRIAFELGHGVCWAEHLSAECAALREVLKGESITVWQDHPKRKLSQVLEVIEKAIPIAERLYRERGYQSNPRSSDDSSAITPASQAIGGSQDVGGTPGTPEQGDSQTSGDYRGYSEGPHQGRDEDIGS